MFNKIKTVFKIRELRERILFTLMMIGLFRLGCSIPVPYITASAVAAMFTSGSSFEYINMLSGGSLSQCTIFALGVSPYINASIIMQLLSFVYPPLGDLKEQGEYGKRLTSRYTSILALIMSVVLSIGYTVIIYNSGGMKYNTGAEHIFSFIIIMLSFIIGAQCCVWMGGQIDALGTGDGISLMIFIGIISGWFSMTDIFYSVQSLAESSNAYWLLIPLFIIIIAASIVFVVIMNGAEKRVPIQYSGNYNSKGGSSYLPMKVIMAGVMPVIFASAICSVPQTIAMVFSSSTAKIITTFASFNSSNWIYVIIYMALIIMFNAFYVYLQFDPVEVSNNIAGNKGTIPGIRQGKPTAEFLNKSLSGIISIGGISLVLIAVLPILVSNLTGISIQIAGTSLLIVVSVAISFVRNVGSYMTVRHHTGFLSMH